MFEMFYSSDVTTPYYRERLETIENFQLLAVKVVAVAYES